MFLKRISMQGFKSFADRTVIDFFDPITGIVGPNGCGKSNITDAIRWVLGEQSAKSLRGSAMSDVIFAGSGNREAVNLAEVTLVFDNSNHLLPSTYEEIEITRRLHRVDNTSEYLINNQAVRLKDVVDLVLDTGLGRESLGIITQGNIQQFAEAKPEDRRNFFEEAAGVAKYKKRKHESELALDRTQINLNRLSDIVSEIEKQVEPLKRQAKKAESYFVKKEELEKIEVAVLVSEIKRLSLVIEQADAKLKDKEANKLISDSQIYNLDTENKDLKTKNRTLDFEIGGLQEKLIKIGETISNLERQKVEIDEKRKYILENASNEEKILQLKELMNEAELSYKDQKKRYDQKQSELDLIKQNIQQIENALSDANSDLLVQKENYQRQLNRLNVINDQLKSPYQYQQGVQTIIDARESLPGILDVVADAIKPLEGYEQAISTALGGSLYHIITTDEVSARNAISFLKRNKTGRATFLPLNIIRSRGVSRDIEIIADNLDGYLGLANNLVDYDERYHDIVGNLLGSTLICDNLETANHLADLIKYTYRIVTLEGDIVNRGGSMTGGVIRDNYSPLTLQVEQKRLENKVDEAIELINDKQSVVDELDTKATTLNDELISKRIELARLETLVSSSLQEFESAKNEYQQINPNDDNNVSDESFTNDLIVKLNDARNQRDQIATQIRLKNDARLRNVQEIEHKEDQIRKIRRELSQSQSDDNEITSEKVKAETMRENYLTRLNTEYQMTFENADKLSFDLNIEESKERVLILRNQIKNLGNINPEAPEQYKVLSERYEYLKDQYNDLVTSKQKILEAIKEMDEVMIEKFGKTFNEINRALPEVFVKLFGGGKARLTLVDPNDILNSGVDIDIQPPGKNVQNIRLFSGGEKSLIAICVLFAMLKVRPVPLCLFDEIESALDTANVDRFATYLKEFSNDTQFIVVSHRTGTMQKCDVLYGVTMPQQGVSQMLKVKLSEAQEMAENNNDDETKELS